MFLGGLAATILSKEIFVVEHAVVDVMFFMVFFYLVATKGGPHFNAWYNKTVKVSEQLLS